MVKGKKSINKTNDEERWYILHNIELERQLCKLEKQVTMLKSNIELKEGIISFQQRMMDMMDGALQLFEDGRLCDNAVKVFASETLKQVRKANIDGDLKKAYTVVENLMAERG